MCIVRRIPFVSGVGSELPINASILVSKRFEDEVSRLYRI